MVTYVDFSKLISNFCLIMCEFHVLVLTHEIVLSQMKLRNARMFLWHLLLYDLTSSWGARTNGWTDLGVM